MGDRLIFKLGARLFALDTPEVDKVVEVLRLSYLPGQGGIVSGVVSLGGEPVTVVDAARALNAPAPGPGALKKVVVVRRGSMTLGLDIGAAPVTFEWETRPGEDEGAALGGRTPGHKGDKTVEPVDWPALFREAARILSSKGTRA